MIKNIFFSGKLIGKIDYERGVYLSYRNEKHKFHMWGDGFGLSVKILDLLISENIEYIVINYCNKEGYITPIASFLVNGISWKDKSFGVEEEQLILPLKFFKKENEIIINQSHL